MIYIVFYKNKEILESECIGIAVLKFLLVVVFFYLMISYIFYTVDFLSNLLAYLFLVFFSII